MSIDRKKCTQAGLDVEIIRQHQRLLKKSLKSNSWPAPVKVTDACRIDNGRVLPSISNSFIENQAVNLIKIGAFVPAAGASSRYISPFSTLFEFLETGSNEDILKEYKKLMDECDSSWVMPKELNRLNELGQISDTDESSQSRKSVLDSLSKPKALYPCVREGQSYLTLKCLEHLKIKSINHQVFVCPASYKEIFMREAAESTATTNMTTDCIEQDGLMSTIRFLEDGNPASEDHGSYSVVPSGHGSLIRLFPKIKSKFRDLDALFIRNIDNVNGTNPAPIDATNHFLSSYQCISSLITEIRESLKKADLLAAAKYGEKIRELAIDTALTKTETNFLSNLKTDEERSLWAPILSVFHSQIPTTEKITTESLLAYYSKPFNLMGVVANNGTDVGGTPVSIKDETGEGEIKVCLEIPHASEQDQKEFFKDPTIATHFNPVFVAAELVEDVDCYLTEDNPFWLLTRKKWRGKDVRYFETILYELLGNSKMANVIFLEVPRCVFNPHKSLNDTVGRSISDWIAD